MSIKNVRSISIILLIFMSLNFICEKKVEAGATATIGAIELLEFIIVCASTGIVYKDIIDAREMFEEYQKKNNPPEPPDPKKSRKAILAYLGLQTGISINNLIQSIVDFFKELGFNEGENVLDLDEYPSFGTINNIYYSLRDEFIRRGETRDYNCWITINGSEEFKLYGWQNCDMINGDDSVTRFSRSTYSFKVTNIVRHGTQFKVFYEMKDMWFDTTVESYYKTFYIESFDDNYELPVPKIRKPINFNVDKNSYLNTGNESDVKPIYPNLENIILNNPNIETIIDQNGNVHYKYTGTEDQLLQDLANRSNLQNVVTDKPQSILQNPEGDILLNPVENPIPEPPPGPGADVNPNVEPEELPFPEFEVVDEPTTGLGFGKIISLLKQLINWVVKVFNRIGNFFKVPEDLAMNIDLSPFKNFTVTDRFPFSIPWDLKNALMGFVGSPVEPDFAIDLDTAYFNVHQKIDLGFIKYFVGFFRYSCIVFFSLFLITKTRDLIKW